jgi:heptaprenyl diphosphate synthase
MDASGAVRQAMDVPAGGRARKTDAAASVASDAQTLFGPILAELAEFECRLEASVAADLGPMAEAMRHIVRAGGKRIRPALVILTSRMGNPLMDHVYDLAMGLEFIHTATLVHDDLIDRSPTRRGMTTLHETMGMAPAIIIGDYYFAKGANLTSAIGLPEIDAAISNTVMTICMGELLQMTSKDDFHQSLEDYHRKIARKTATLLATCCFCGGVVGGLAPERRDALQRYGHKLGMAFQIADDLLDYVATEEELGKPVGADLRQGTVTLPFMLAFQDPVVGPELASVLEHQPRGEPDYEHLVDLVRRSGAVAATEMAAHEFARDARGELAVFPPSPARATLEAACDYVVGRRI